VKEAVFFDESATFPAHPPGACSLDGAGGPGGGYLSFTRQRLSRCWSRTAFLRDLNTSIDEVVEEAKVPGEGLSDVLLVGGSTLLPGVSRYWSGASRGGGLRAWQPSRRVALRGAPASPPGAWRPWISSSTTMRS